MNIAALKTDPRAQVRCAPRPVARPVQSDEQEGGLARQVCRQEQVVAAALLVAVAFRMKDERGLVTTLRQLSLAVEALTHHDVDD